MKLKSHFRSLLLSVFVGGLLSFTIIHNNVPSIYPLNGDVTISSNYGKRIHPITHESKMHVGVDFKAKIGTPVIATADGVVTKIEYLPNGYGNKITLQHKDNIQTIYAQLETINVKEGQKISQKDLIGTVGNTGKSTGPHLHYEVVINGDHMDPNLYFGVK